MKEKIMSIQIDIINYHSNMLCILKNDGMHPKEVLESLISYLSADLSTLKQLQKEFNDER